MMGDEDMGCPEHGKWELINGILQCPVCGLHSRSQPVPSQAELIKENKQLKIRVSDLECFLQDFILKLELQQIGFVRRAKRLMRLSNTETHQNQ